MNDDDSDDVDSQQLEPYSEDSDGDKKKEEKQQNFCLRILNLPKKLKINLLRDAIKERRFTYLLINLPIFFREKSQMLFICFRAEISVTSKP